MTATDRVAHEARLRPRQAAIAAAGGIMLLAAATVQAAGTQPKVDEVTVQLIAIDKRALLQVLGAVINALGLLALALTLGFLFVATRARRPQLSKGMWITTIVGAVLAVIGGIAYGAVISVKAHQFVTQTQTQMIPQTQTYPQAHALLSSAGLAVLQYAGLVGSLLLAVAFVLISLNAMRVGLLTKFLGYLGIVAAAASLLLIGSAPALLVEVFWLLAIAYLLSGRWPNGSPPAWATGQAEPWPSGAELREQRQRMDGGRGARGKPAGKPAAARPPETVAAVAPGTRSGTPKRKRKRRR